MKTRTQSRPLKKTEYVQQLMLPPDTRLGPAMKALGDRHRVFAIACANMGAKINAAEAARIAGYSDIGEGCKVRGHELTHDPRILAAIQELSREKVQFATLQAVEVVKAVMNSPRSGAATKLKAATILLDRGGVHALTEHKVSITHDLSRDEKILRLLELAKAQGMDPKALLGNLAESVEVPVRDVTDGGGA